MRPDSSGEVVPVPAAPKRIPSPENRTCKFAPVRLRTQSANAATCFTHPELALLLNFRNYLASTSMAQLLCPAEINKRFLYIPMRFKYLKTQIQGDACFVGVKRKRSSKSGQCLH